MGGCVAWLGRARTWRERQVRTEVEDLCGCGCVEKVGVGAHNTGGRYSLFVIRRGANWLLER